jgi:hypothetical protein
VLILNKKSITGQESQLFEAELEKFRPHQNRLLQANHKQSSLMKELTRTYGDLLQDKRVQSEQSKYESITRQRNAVMARYKKVYEAFNGLTMGIAQARKFYNDMSDNVDSLRKNVETFISNRRSEGAQLLSQIERDKAVGVTDQEDLEREKLRQLMERLSTEPKPSSTSPSTGSIAPPSKIKSPPPHIQAPAYGAVGPEPKMSPRYPPAMPGAVPLSHSPAPYGQYMGGTPGYNPSQPFQQGAAAPLSDGYNPMAYPYQTPVSPPPNQQYFSQTPTPYSGYPSASPAPSAAAAAQPSHYMAPQGYIPPPPPPRPQQTQYPPSAGGVYPSGPGGYAQARPPYGHSKTPSQSQQPPSASNDPWAGLNAWK